MALNFHTGDTITISASAREYERLNEYEYVDNADTGRNKWINDACRDKLEGLQSAASEMGKIGGSRSSEKKTIAARENAKKPRPRNRNIVSK